MVSDKPRRIDGVLCKELGNETLLYWADGKTIHVVNRTALAIWELCDGQHTLPEMEEAIRTQFQAPAQQIDIQGDILRTLQTFVDKGLVQA
jgi:hypothetical protein